jgi:hypothetical protein
VQIRTSILSAAFICAALAGCDYMPQHKVATAQPFDETFRDFGTYEIHYSAVRTDALPAEVARSYGIQRSKNRAMLNVTVLRKEADHAPRKPIDADVKVDAYNLNGQLKNIEMRRLAEGDAIYYIGEVSIGGAEILVFELSVTPQGESAPLNVKFKREFDTV